MQKLCDDRIRQWLPMATLAVLVIIVGAVQPGFLDPGTLLQLASGAFLTLTVASLAGRVTQPPLSAPLSRAGHGLVEGHDPIRKHFRCRQIVE